MFVLDAVYGQVMSISEKDVANFYDNYADRQKAVGFNLRQYTLVEKLIDLGMSAQSNVLEIGCGVGQVSALIAGTVTKGQIVSCDISPKSIEEAKKLNVMSKNIRFEAADMVVMDFTDQSFDFISMFDVLEHIPEEKLSEIFERLAAHMHQDTKLLINIPNPSFLETIIENEKDKTQIIDQPLPADDIMNAAYSNGLILDFFITHDIWQKKDYQMMLFTKEKPYVAEKISEAEFQAKKGRLLSKIKPRI
ncbi:MAG: class I SAM-dependent methyltransferase [Myxococcota bacterium]|nr:class I SAM-dependent methyltransferase [Myxococcota bacterium]